MTRSSAPPQATSPLPEIPEVVGRLEQARNEQARFRVWLAAGVVLAGCPGDIHFVDVHRLDVGRAFMG